MTSTSREPARFVNIALWPIALAVVWALIGSSFVIGIDRGMDHKISIGPLNEFHHLTVAISDDVYHLDQGYVGFGKVIDSLKASFGIEDWNAWGSDPQAYAALKAKLDDGELINKALATAASIPGLAGLGQAYPATLDTYQKLYLHSPVGEDLGESAFFEMAFRLFGLHIQGAYYLFFFFFATSALVFIFEFYDNRSAICLLLLCTLSFHLFFYMDFFRDFVPTVYINRFASTLCIVPALHICLLLSERRAAHWWSLVFAAVQLFVLLFGIFIRSSGTWTMLGVCGLFALQSAAGFFRTRAQPFGVRLGVVWSSVRVWPVALIVGGVIGLGFYISAATHPLYHTLDNPPHHMRWHNAWIGLQLNPDWKNYYPAQNNMSDSGAFNFTWDHYKAMGRGDEFNSKYTHEPRMGLHDQYIEQQFIKFFEEHPVFVLKTIFYYKPIAFVRQISDLLGTLSLGASVPIAAILLLTVSLCLGDDGNGRSEARTAGIVVVLFGVSLAPVFWAYPQIFVMADQVWMTSLLILTILWAGLLGIARIIVEAVRRPAEI